MAQRNAADTTATVSCPTCGKTVEWNAAQRWRPFCSQRCKLIDLGEWLDENHRIPGLADPEQQTQQWPLDKPDEPS
jgi:endogenous inhibitor of DNA gyrase (YacG/DUF329 family)